MTVSNKNFKTAVSITSTNCRFELCTFQQANYRGNLVSTSVSNLKCSFTSCLFNQIEVTSSYYVIHISSATEGILDRSCFSEITSSHVYYSEPIGPISINSTACTKCKSLAPMWRATKQFTSLYDNHSFFSASSVPYSNCYLLKNSPSTESTNCFFHGSSCNVNVPFHYDVSSNGFVISHYNMVNNTDSNGYFRVCNSFGRTLRNSVISYKSNTNLVWFEYTGGTGSLTIEKSFIIASAAIQAHKQMTIASDVKFTDSASTLAPFNSHPLHKQCSYFYLSSSDQFTLKYRKRTLLFQIRLFAIF